MSQIINQYMVSIRCKSRRKISKRRKDLLSCTWSVEGIAVIFDWMRILREEDGHFIIIEVD